MKTLLWTMLLFGTTAALSGCGETAREEPAGAPPVFAPPHVEVLEEPADAGGQAAPESPPAATQEAAEPDNAAADAEEPAAEPMPEQSADREPAVKKTAEGSSTRKVLGAVQRALMKAATGGSEEQPQSSEAPKFR